MNLASKIDALLLRPSWRHTKAERETWYADRIEVFTPPAKDEPSIEARAGDRPRRQASPCTTATLHSVSIADSGGDVVDFQGMADKVEE